MSVTPPNQGSAECAAAGTECVGSHLFSGRYGKDAALFSLSPHQRAGLSGACDLAIMVRLLNAVSGGNTSSG